MSTAFAIALFAAFVAVGVFRDRLRDHKRYHHSLGLYLACLILVFVVPQVYVVGTVAAIVTVPVGTILGFCSAFILCRALVSPEEPDVPR